MKLHLPSRLRAAVIACMAAFAPMAVTIATGTLTAAAALAYLAPQAQATDYTITTKNSSDWTTATTDDTITVNMTEGYLPTGAVTGGLNIVAPVSVTSMVLTNGFSGSTYNFSGSISGAGDFKWNPSASVTSQTYAFSGDVSGYTGSMSIVGNTNTLKFTGDSTIAAASITTSGTLSLSGTREVTGTITATKTSIGAGSAITLSNTGTQSLGALTVDVSSCTDTSASLLTVSGDLTVGSLTLSNYSSLAAGTYNLITLKDADAATALKAALTDATEYTFSTEGSVLKMTITGDVYVVTTSGDTKLTSAAAGDKLIINLTGWLPNSSDRSYPMRCLADVEIQNMILNDGSSGRTYQFEGAVTGSGPIQYTKAGVTGYTLAFIGDFSGYTGDIDFTGDSTSTLRFANTTVNAASINLNSTLNLQGTVVMNSPVVTVTTTLTDSAAVTINNTFETGKLTEATGCSITIGDAGNLTVGGDLDVAGLNITSTGTLTLADDASVTGKTINIGGTVAVTSGVTIAVDNMTAVGTGPDLTVTGLQSAGEYQIIGADTSVTGLDQATFTLAGVEQTATVTDKNVQLGTFFNIAATDSKTVAEVITAAGGASYDYINALGTLSGVSDGVTTLAPVAGTGTVVVDGTLADKVSSLSTFTGTIKVVEGGALQTSADVTADVQLAGGELDTTGITWSSNLAVTEDSTISSTDTITMTGVISGSGDITKTGSGKVTISGNATNTGVLTINAGEVRWGTASSGDTSEHQTNTIAFSEIVVNSGTDFEDSHKGADYSTTNITLNNGTLYAYAQEAGSVMKYGTLKVSGTSSIQAYWKRYTEFAALTSEANADATLNFGGGNWDNNSYVTIDKLNNFDGTINPAASGNAFKLNISDVHQDAGYEATVNGTATSTNFLKTGDGSLTLTALNASGTLGMNYGGTLAVTTLTLTADTLLSYDSSLTGGVLTLSSMDNVTALDLDKVTTIGEDGFDLGIVSSVDEATLKAAMGLYDDTQYTLDNSGANWVLKGAVVVKTDWDKNWGAAGLANQPATVTQATLDATTALVGSAYDDGTTTAIELTGGGSASVDVYGGASEAASTRNSWIKATGGTYGFLVGGNYADNWISGSAASFVGDSHILLDGATVNHIVGGNLKDGKGPGFTGSSYISIVSGTVNGSVVGSTAVAHNNSTTMTGSTHIFIYTPLAAGSTKLYDATPNAVIGGACWGTNSSGTQTLNGDTNITLDLNTTTEAATFGKRIIGSAFMASNMSTVVGGSTNISITNAGNVTFSDEIVGASHSEGSGTTTVGTTNVTIDSGTFSGNVIGGSYMGSSGSDAITATNVTISGGTFSAPVAAGSWVSGGSSTIGSTTLTITDGTFKSDVYGGDRATATTNTISGKATTAISGGTFSANVVGAGCDAGSGTKLTVGGVEMSLTGGTVAGSVIGGVYDTATGSVVNTHSVGDINLTVDGATLNGAVYGGSYMQRNAATGSATTGNVTVNLTSGSVAGNVYGAGLVNGTATQTTAGVTVNVGKEMAFTGTSQIISGGFGGSKATNGTVTGSSTLNLAADAQTAAVTAADFTSISVADGAATLQAVTGTSTAKTGAGALTVTDKVSSNALDVQAGALTLTAGADNLNSGALAVSVASGATLTTGAALTGVSSLTLGAGSTLGIGSLTTGAAALADNATVTFGTINLVSTAAAVEGIVLLTNVTEAQLKTITWTTDAAGQRSVAAGTALAGMTLNGAAVTLSDYKLVIDDTAKTLSLAAADLYWEGGASGTWNRTTTNTPWSTTDGGTADSAFLNTAPVHFTTTGDVAVTVGEAVNTPSLSVEKGNVTLTDASKLTASAISVAKDASLSVDGLANDTAAVTNNGTLTSTATTLTVASLDNTGTVNAAGLSVTGNVTGTGDIGTTGDLSVGGNTAAGDISVAGAATFTGNVAVTKLTATGALSVGGTTTASEISADSATFTGAASVTKLTTTGATTNNGGLTIGNGSSLGSLAGTGDLTTSGTVGITGAATAGTVTNSGTLSAASLTATKLTGTGTTTVTGTLSLSGSDTTGAVSADKVTLTGNASFGKLTATNGVTAKGTLSVGADSSLGAVTGVTTLTTTGATTLTSVNDGAAIAANADTNITGTQATSLSGLSGTGALTTGGDLTLTAAPTTTQAVTTAGALTLSAGGTLGATTVNGTTLTLGDDTTLASLGGALTTIAVTEGAIDTATTILTIGGNLTPTTLSYTLADSDLTSIGAYLSNGNSYTLTSVTGTNSLTSVTLNGTGTEFAGSGYKLTISVSGKTVILTKSATGNEWISTDGKWTSDSGFIEVVPTTGTAAFYGNGTAGVAVTGDKTVSAVHVEIPDAGTVQEYTFTGDSVTASTLDIVKGGLVLENTVNATTSTIDEDGTLTIGDGGTLSGTTLTNDGTVTVDDNGTMTLSGALTNNGTLEVNDGTLSADSLSNTKDATLNLNKGSEATVTKALTNEGTLTVADGGSLTVGSLAGSGSLTVGKDGTLVVEDGVVSKDTLENNKGTIELENLSNTDKDSTIAGTIILTGDGSYAGSYATGTTVEVAKGATQSLVAGANLTAKGDSGSALTIDVTGGAATIDGITTDGSDVTISNKAGESATNQLTLTNASAIDGGSLTLYVSAKEVVNNTDKPVLTTGAALSLSNTAVVVNQTETTAADLNVSAITGDKNILLFYISNNAASSVDTDTCTLTVNSSILKRYFSNIHMEEGSVEVVGDRRTTYYSETIGGESDNGKAGLTLASNALSYIDPQVTNPTGALAGVLDALDDYDDIINDASSSAAAKAAALSSADKLASALSGASIASMGAALSGDMERQLRAIRNRTTTMGVNQSQVNEDMPYFNAWVNAEGDYRKMNADGTLSGYELSSWGGTVGFDVDCTPSFTCGLAMTAMYGDFTAKSEDKAEGDLDTYYVTAFARYAKHRWTNTFVASVGMADTSLDRTVNGSKVSGDSDGMMFGALYELGYVIPLDKDGDTCLQPIVNVAYTHTTLNGYSEQGSDIALTTGDVELNRVTFGAGARLQTVIGENLYNRSSILELRALVKADAGDRDAEADVTFAGMGLSKVKAKSAEMGAVGGEFGVGLTVPVSQDGGSIFMDASAEIRADYSNVNATVGYRINF